MQLKSVEAGAATQVWAATAPELADAYRFSDHPAYLASYRAGAGSVQARSWHTPLAHRPPAPFDGGNSSTSQDLVVALGIARYAGTRLEPQRSLRDRLR